MHANTTEHSIIGERLDAIEAALANLDSSSEQLSDVRRSLRGVAESAREASRDDLQGCATVLSDLAEIARFTGAEPEGGAAADSGAILELVRAGLAALRGAVDEEPEARERIEAFLRDAREQWGDYLSLLEESGGQAGAEGLDAWNDPSVSGSSPHGSNSGDDRPEEDQATPADSTEQIGRILAALGTATPQTSDVGGQESGVRSQGSDHSPLTAISPPAPGAVEMDEELLEAYLDDANRCLASMEEAALAFEADPAGKDPLQQLCRELHTLKGASASVGLTDLGDFLHKVEDSIQQSFAATGSTVDLDAVLQSVDTVRKQISALSGAGRSGSQTGRSGPETGRGGSGPDRNTAPGRTEASPRVDLGAAFDSATPATEETLRVKASHLDRLMDMLAELVMLRNRRDTHVVRLKRITEELGRCMLRLRAFSDDIFTMAFNQTATPARLDESGTSASGRALPPLAQQSNSLTELGDDLAEILRVLRDVHAPIAEENLAVSRFVRQFRQELVELRRLPVSGLFRRLQRAARDAARAEGKQVRLELAGEHAGLERSLQERLYEPLLHLVRNAVSHGIESPSDRTAAGKDPMGTVTLQAQGGPNLLVFEVRDDGRGLDYDALRRRGLQRGLLSGDRPASREELAQLIFHPGFSTRETATEISGRGVGMDVVAATLERMHSRIEIDSNPGQGTTMRLTIPLRSVIEHTMVFRSSGQLFAVAMQSIRSAGPVGSDSPQAKVGRPRAQVKPPDGVPVVRLRDALSLPGPPAQSPEQILVLGHGSALAIIGGGADEPRASSGGRNGASRRVTLLVDEIIGPEEVVVRSLPPLFKRHRLFSGATLSGGGETVLLFDSQALIDLGLVYSGQSELVRKPQPVAAAGPAGRHGARRVLVVDDSLSARRSLVRKLGGCGFEIAEASDGLEALERFRSEHFDVVFTDMEMPRLGGLELVAELRNSHRSDALRIFVVTSRREDEFRTRARELGADAYLTKPVTDGVLDDVLSQFGLNGRELAEAT